MLHNSVSQTRALVCGAVRETSDKSIHFLAATFERRNLTDNQATHGRVRSDPAGSWGLVLLQT